MNIAQVHMEIEQGLSSLGVFNNGDVLHDEIDIAINTVVYNELREIFKGITLEQNPNAFERNQYQADFVRLLKDSTIISLTKNQDTYEGNLPDNYLHGISSYSNVINNKKAELTLDGGKGDLLEIGKKYTTQSDVKMGTAWYANGTTFLASVTTFYGIVTMTSTNKVKNRLIRSEKITHDESSLFATARQSPIAEMIGSKIIIYTNNKFEVEDLYFVYIKKFRKSNYNTGVNLEFSEDVLSYIIQKTIIHLGIQTEQSQQKLVNLRTESI